MARRYHCGHHQHRRQRRRGPAATNWSCSGTIIADGATVVVHGSGKFDLGGKNEQLNTAVQVESGLIASGSIATGAGTLTANGGITATVQPGTLGSNVSNIGGTVTGTVALNHALIGSVGSATRTITVNDGIADTDLQISATIVDGDATAPEKQLPAISPANGGTFTLGVAANTPGNTPEQSAGGEDGDV